LDQDREFKNILVIHFGQLGDVVLGLPALRAIRERFSRARITLMVGKATADIAKLARVADDHIVVDRVAIRDGSKLWSLGQMASLLRDVRRRKFDFVIDLHSFYETNLIGFLAGIPTRLYSNRENRSIDRLSNFRPRPPAEDKEQHYTERYLDVLKPLGITGGPRFTSVEPDAADGAKADEYLAAMGGQGTSRIGLFLGAGHPARVWPAAKFAAVARALSNEGCRILVFLGPEERHLRDGLGPVFGDSAGVVPEMPLTQFFAMLSRLELLVAGDTGPMHLAALAGTGVVLLSEVNTTQRYRPRSPKLEVIEDRPFRDITPEVVIDAVARLRARLG
jgi:ADP-heptose:LPS heptosyltransferase